MDELNLDIEITIKQTLHDGEITYAKVSAISIDSAIQWLGSMERMMLREAAESEIAESLEEKDEKQYKDRPDWEEITGGAQNL